MNHGRAQLEQTAEQLDARAEKVIKEIKETTAIKKDQAAQIRQQREEAKKRDAEPVRSETIELQNE